MAEERNIDRDEDEFESEYRKNPYAQLPSNSSKALSPAVSNRRTPKRDAVVEGGEVRRRSEDRREKGKFRNTLSKIGNYILKDVLIPTGKEIISTVVQNSTDMILYGESRGKRRRDWSYASYYNRRSGRERERERDDYRERRPRPANDWDDIWIPKFDKNGNRTKNTLASTEQVLKDLFDIANTFGKASVADLYDLAGMSAPYTDLRRGWHKGELRGSYVVTLTGDEGWLIVTPDPGPIEDD